MSDISRRGFLLGSSAAIVAAAVAPAVLRQVWTPPIFEGYIGEYNGVIIREMPPLTIADLKRVMAHMAKHVVLPEPDGRYRFVVAPDPWSTRRVVKMIGTVDNG